MVIGPLVGPLYTSFSCVFVSDIQSFLSIQNILLKDLLITCN